MNTRINHLCDGLLDQRPQSKHTHPNKSTDRSPTLKIFCPFLTVPLHRLRIDRNTSAASHINSQKETMSLVWLRSTLCHKKSPQSVNSLRENILQVFGACRTPHEGCSAFSNCCSDSIVSFRSVHFLFYRRQENHARSKCLLPPPPGRLLVLLRRNFSGRWEAPVVLESRTLGWSLRCCKDLRSVFRIRKSVWGRWKKNNLSTKIEKNSQGYGFCLCLIILHDWELFTLFLDTNDRKQQWKQTTRARGFKNFKKKKNPTSTKKNVSWQPQHCPALCPRARPSV